MISRRTTLYILQGLLTGVGLHPALIYSTGETILNSVPELTLKVG